MQPKNLLILAESSTGQALSATLEQEGHHVTVAPSSPAIMATVRTAGYDAVIADISSAASVDTTLPTLEEVERRHIERVLDETRFNLSRASRVLAIDRTTLYNKLKRFGLQRDSIRARRLAVQSGAHNGSTVVEHVVSHVPA